MSNRDTHRKRAHRSYRKDRDNYMNFISGVYRKYGRVHLTNKLQSVIDAAASDMSETEPKART